MGHRHRKDLAASRRRVEDGGDEESVLDAGSLSDDSLTEGSIISEEEGGEGDEIAHHEDASMASAKLAKTNGSGIRTAIDDKASSANGNASGSTKPPKNAGSDMDLMLNGLTISEENGIPEELHYEDLREDVDILDQEPSLPVVQSTAQMDRQQEQPYERRRREHEEYKKKRDADPAFVPNRGAFFMHDHRHSGPAANGFRPFGRGRGRGRPGIGGPYAPSSQMPQSFESTDAPWAHDMHEVISEPYPRHAPSSGYANNASNFPAQIPISAPSTAPPNRALSTTKHIGNVQIRVFLSNMDKPIVFPGIPVKQYTRLPDHRPPMRRDKPVRISIPDYPPRYIFPAVDRSFIFIPRAMRPNQQGFGGRGRGPRSAFGSIGGYSRRTSVFGGSVHGSTYAPSVAMSRRSSLAREVNRDTIISPNGSVLSRPQMSMDPARPVVKLPPTSQSVQPQPLPRAGEAHNGPPPTGTIDERRRPPTYPLPQKPTFRENRPNPIPMHQPRPQKAVSVADIESPAGLSFNPPQQHQQPFHQQVPMQANGNSYSLENMHSRNPSYPSQASTGTPLSQIPERAIHAQPFQPNPYQPQPQQPSFYPQPYQVIPPPPPPPPPQGYYYPQQFNPSVAPGPSAPPFAPAQPPPPQQPSQQPDASQAGSQNLVAQEVNGMVYYYDAAQIPAVATFPAYQQPPAYPMPQVGGVMGMGGMMTPSPDGFYYPQAPQAVVYYQQ
ncbi:CASC3/Barentsz eIF4AIII binding-domain-containing protein [Amylocarpus encephaloides]|uniref:CASC3/Barentsz eIF4AIII binding-domain-containing protein n=1 Tax=Amylocarpus encephaloides TaxID=45428 RepID=A0A9P7Y7S7_9HELO|nr:CASC3/Barentsz eIF4AIII binding-domain-containing protein [Amylocarpus encephaloides]